MKKLLLITITIALFLPEILAQKDSTHFVTTWRTYNSGTGGDSTVVIPVDTNYTYSFDVDWNNDGVFDDFAVTDTIVHQYSDTGTYTIRIKGTFPRFYDLLSVGGFNEKLIALEQWGTNPWLKMEWMFGKKLIFTYNAVDTPNLTFITSLDYLFANNIDFNGDVSNWDVSRIKTMNYTFSQCINFNQPLSNWDVSNVNSMLGLFALCSSFNQPLNNWIVDSVRNFEVMFRRSGFNQPLNNWNVGNGVFFGFMFEDCTFNQPINNWNVSQGLSFRQMFSNNVAFNQPLDNWSVDSATNMEGMFQNSVFNQPLPSWNTSNVLDFRRMFSGNSVFNQDIGNWDIPNDAFFVAGKMSGMLDGTNMSTANYDNTLIKWSHQNKIGVDLGAAGLSYCISDSIRNDLISNHFWRITGDSLNCLGVDIDEIESFSEVENFTFYPNPNNGLFFIESSSKQLTNEAVLVYNMQGKLIHTSTLRVSKQQIDLGELKSGIYLVRVGAETKRIVVM